MMQQADPSFCGVRLSLFFEYQLTILSGKKELYFQRLWCKIRAHVKKKEEPLMKVARLVLKIVGAALALAAATCLIIAFWDKLTGCLSSFKGDPHCDDYDDEVLYE